MALPDAVVAHDDRMRRITAATLLQMRSLWRRLGSGDWDVAWRTLGPQLLTVMVAAQVAAVREADAYVSATVAALNLPDRTQGQVSPNGLAGTASDGRPLLSLLYEPVIAARAAGARLSLNTAQALSAGRESLDRIVLTQVADAGRAAESVATVTRPGITGYVRMVSPPCCDRCAILAGRHYRWNEGFQRHPRCDCRHIPASEDVAGDLTTDPRQLIEQGKVHGLSDADRKAIAEDGADPGQVINAHRGMSTAQGLKATRAGKAFRQGGVRLRPESIYKIAGDDRDEALRLLRRFGYVI